MSKNRKIIRAIVFMVLLVCSFLVIQKLFRFGEISNASMYKSFSKEEDSLDAVYIGSSATYSFWNPLLAWKQTGYKVFSYSVSLMPAKSVKTMLADARDAQPDSLYIVSLNALKKENLSYNSIHFLVDYYPDTLKKIPFIHNASSQISGSVFDKLEYYFPIIRFHSNLDRIDDVFLTENYPDYKSSMHFDYYLTGQVDYTPIVKPVKSKSALDENLIAVLQDLLDYCKTNDLNVLFVVSPQPVSPTKNQEQLNYLADEVAKAGFPVLNLEDSIDELQLDITCDYYDWAHTNIHGSIKFTSMLCDYLKENYNFTDKRGLNPDDSWDDSYDEYLNLITPYTFDFERDFCERDNSLVAPKITKITTLTSGIQVEWESLQNAESYHLYRKENDDPWEKIASLDGTCSYIDSDANPKKINTYAVVASRKENGKEIYGNCNYAGYCLVPSEEQTAC